VKLLLASHVLLALALSVVEHSSRLLQRGTISFGFGVVEVEGLARTTTVQSSLTRCTWSRT